MDVDKNDDILLRRKQLLKQAASPTPLRVVAMTADVRIEKNPRTGERGLTKLLTDRFNDLLQSLQKK